VGKESVEGYEGGNWPSKTGNPSGGGRGNAEPSGDWDDGCDAGVASVSKVLLSSQIAERNRALMEPRLPAFSFRAKDIEGTVEHFNFQARCLNLVEFPGLDFQLSDALVSYYASIQDWAPVTMHLIGDNLKLKVEPPRWGRCSVVRIANHSIDQGRLDAEYFPQFGSGHAIENELRRGRFSSRVAAGYALYNPLGDGSKPKWFVKSGDFLISQLAFASLEHAALWMDSMSAHMGWRNGPEFRLRGGLFTCFIVDANGKPPSSWI